MDLEGQSVGDIWNNCRAQEFRASILDGSFRFCIREECPFLNQDVPIYWEPNGPPFMSRDKITDPRLQDIIRRGLTTLADGPLVLNCGYDRTCNLSCPSCRLEPIGLKGEEIQREIDFQDKIFGEIGAGLRILYLSGSGDPFASHVYRQLLRGLSRERFPDLEVHLNTNAQLWTRANWEALGEARQLVTTTHISVDAATAETYSQNRRGGSWVTLQQNLELVAELRRKGPLRFVTLSFVVQANNFQEMPAFIAMTERFGFDLVYFHKFCKWGCCPEEFRQKAIHEPWHRQNHEFLRSLKNDIFTKPSVGLYCLRKYRSRAMRLDRFGEAGFALLKFSAPFLSFLERQYPRILRLSAWAGKLVWGN